VITRYLHTVVLLGLAILFTSCAREFLNPYDPATPPDAWMPQDLSVDVLGPNSVRLSWQQDELHIDGFAVRREMMGQSQEFILPADNTRFTDLNVTDIAQTDTCVTVVYSVMALAGANISAQVLFDPLIFPLTTQANAGSDQTFGTSATSTTLSANAPASGETGQWSVVSGTGGSFSNVGSPNATFTAQPCTDYVLRWTIAGVCSVSSDDMLVSFQQQTTQANAGPDITAGALTVNLAANPPAEGEIGQWSVVSGTGGVFSNAAAYNSTFFGLSEQVYVLQWRLEGPCSVTLDEMSIRMPLVDSDGNAYTTVVIGSQEWMAENLRTTKYANGDPIPHLSDNSQWASATSGAWAHYNNDSQYESPYGKLYNWYTVNDPRNVCPAGWHVPADAEWTVLTDYLGGESVAGGKMKSTGTQYWISPNAAATNESGFSALAGGYRNGLGSFSLLYYQCFWWSATEVDAHSVWYRFLNYNTGSVFRFNNNKGNGFSLRCLRD
jgi:uncharacterized protein (TIGR02145 family)